MAQYSLVGIGSDGEDTPLTDSKHRKLQDTYSVFKALAATTFDAIKHEKPSTYNQLHQLLYTKNKAKEFHELLKMPTLWTRSYFVSTAGNVSGKGIQQYIEAQKGA